jgi:hypothetical protein
MIFTIGDCVSSGHSEQTQIRPRINGLAREAISVIRPDGKLMSKELSIDKSDWVLLLAGGLAVLTIALSSLLAVECAVRTDLQQGPMGGI